MSLIRTLLGIGSLGLFWGCQTVTEFRDPDLPAIYASSFASCGKGEGGGRVLFEHDNGAMSSEYEWVSHGGLQGRLLNPMGQTLLGFASEKKRLKFRGALASSVPEIGFDEDGYILLEGQWVGLKLEEAVCLLNQKWPIKWLRKVTSTKSSILGYSLKIDDDEREIRLHLGHRGIKLKSSCAMINWNAFLFFAPQEIKVCIDSQQSRMTVDSSGYRILWDKEDSW